MDVPEFPAANADSDNNGSEMNSRANVPSFSAEDNANAECGLIIRSSIKIR